MREQTCHRSGKENPSHDDGPIPEINFPKTSNASHDIPSEFDNNIPRKENEDSRPGKDGPH